TISNWDLSTDYRPAVGGRVGGDWYDAFVLPDGRLTVVLGDVAGHGLAAAGAMAQLRNALRSLLFTGATPADALSQLNAFSRHLMARAFATAVAVRIDLDSGRTEAASAGHLMPYLTGGRTPVTAAPIRLSPPIGVKGGSYAHSEFVLERGQGLVMFSDGLVERRDGTIDDGLERLARVLDRAGDSAAQQISSAMRPEDTDDDVTVITLRRR
ncbi:PP2C family protein-serine/threonine phosphatase, partial [Mycolicibacterium diernhoferi]